MRSTDNFTDPRHYGHYRATWWLLNEENARPLSHESKQGPVAHRAELHLGECGITPIKGRRNEMVISQSIDVGTHESSDWWALYTRHQHEKTVAEMLSAKGFEVFLPLYESLRRWKDRSKMLTLPLFPCYVFVRGGLDRRLQVVTTPGIHMILCRGERVAMIPQAEIDAIRRAVE